VTANKQDALAYLSVSHACVFIHIDRLRHRQLISPSQHVVLHVSFSKIVEFGRDAKKLFACVFFLFGCLIDSELAHSILKIMMRNVLRVVTH